VQQEKTMRKSTKAALAFLAIAGASGSAAFAADDEATGRFDGRDGRGMRFERADADNSGDITFEEFSAVISTRLGTADANGDGKMTVGEIASEIQRMRSERMAERIVQRFDANGDGMLTLAEIESRQKKMFALMDRNDDGKIVKDEMPSGRRGKGWN
jgi:Ca2+-binding EF-hand superfamily protein